MAQLSDDCFAFAGGLTPVDTALDHLLVVLVPIAEPETVALASAHGRILATTVVAGEMVPPHDNSAVDGYAVYFDDLSTNTPTTLPVAGIAAAGHPFFRPQERGEAVWIFTGAPMPTGADNVAPDTVMMQEDCTETGDLVVLPPGIKRGANRRFAGEDVKVGDIILEAGQVLRAQEIGLAASVGVTNLSVRTPLRAAIFSTGDEVRDPGTARKPGTIYDSNRFTLAALLKGVGCVVDDLGILPDDQAEIGRALTAAAESHDVILTSGGVSAGAEDHVRGAIAEHGSMHFWRLAIKPGRPIALGQVARVPFVGLPGNPVAAMVTFLCVARPLILRLAGRVHIKPRSFQVRAGFAYKK
ncbi:MAG: molybdopterin molybdenumtransferase MoeA, partial [Rhodospirillaceae bacterium]|nr:molybdopterin molybdenumtransferase MoeA [Rhodospirillaceae bacterium]